MEEISPRQDVPTKYFVFFISYPVLQRGNNGEENGNTQKVRVLKNHVNIKKETIKLVSITLSGATALISFISQTFHP